MVGGKLALIVVACSSFSLALGYAAGDSNLDVFGYPAFTSKHFKPVKPFVKDQYSVETYKGEVERYVQESQEYVKACDNDVDLVQLERHKAIQAANEAIDEYNNFVRYGY